MKMTRRLIISAVCAVACSQAQALLSVNVLQDDTTVPGWVINTFTVDSLEQDVTAAVALTDLSSGSMLQLPGFGTFKQSNGPGDSYVSINGDPNTNGWLGYGDLQGGGITEPFFDETGIGMTWYNIRQTDNVLDMHLATLTFSADTVGDFDLLLAAASGQRRSEYSITNGYLELISTIDPGPIPEPPVDPNPLPDPGDDYPGENPGGDPGDNPGGNPGGNPSGGGSPIPEPAGLGLIALIAVAIGGLHRRRLVDAGV